MKTPGTPVILAVDAGNSTISLGVFRGESLAASFSMPARPPLSGRAYCDAWRQFLEKNSLTPPVVKSRGKTGQAASQSRAVIPAILSSVVPRLTAPLARALARITGSEPIILSAGTPCSLLFRVPNPAQIGPDRIANAVAAAHRAKGPAAVVDFGTATTITVVRRKATFLGGAIMPGLGLMASSLKTGTGRLPFVAPGTTPPPIGKDTDGAIRTGIVIGTAGAIEKILAGIEKELGFDVQLFLTGGYGPFMSPFITRKHAVVPGLTLEGLRLICTCNISGIPGSRRTHKGGFAT